MQILYYLKKTKGNRKETSKKTREGFKHAGSKIIYDGSDWVLIKIEDNNAIGKDAAIYYGEFKEYRVGVS